MSEGNGNGAPRDPASKKLAALLDSHPGIADDIQKRLAALESVGEADPLLLGRLAIQNAEAAAPVIEEIVLEWRTGTGSGRDLGTLAAIAGRLNYLVILLAKRILEDNKQKLVVTS